MFLKLLGCWCIAYLISVVEPQEVRNSFNNGYDSRYSNTWNLNNGFSFNNNNNNRPFTGNTNNAGSNFFSSNERPNENIYSVFGNEKNSKWGYETVTNTEKTSDWNSKKSTKANNDRQSNGFINRPNEKKSNAIINLPDSSKWDANSNSFSSNSDFSSWGYNNAKPTSEQNNRRPDNWNNDKNKNKPSGNNAFSESDYEDNSRKNSFSSNSNKESNSDFSSWGYTNAKPSSQQNNRRPDNWNNDKNKNKPSGNDVFSESDYEENSVSSWGSNNNKKIKPTSSSYYGSNGRESTTQKNNKNSGNSKWESNNNKKPQKASETNKWEVNNSSQPEKEKTSNPSALDTSILDELDKNDWYFGKESDYPKPPFRSALNIDVSELWNFDRNKKSNQNSRRNGNGARGNNNRRNRQAERLIQRMGGINCECVNVNLCEEEDMIITQFEQSPSDEFICERPTEVCCTNPKRKINGRTGRKNFPEEKTQLQCGQRRVVENQFEKFGDNIAEPGEFPWSLILEYAEFNCSATLIHHKMALTAAHCVTSAQPDELTLKAGIWNTNNEPPQFRKVTKIIQHPDYNSRSPRNDIALLVLETPFKLTDNVNTICLPVTNDKWDSNNCVVAGWRSEKIGEQGVDVLEKDIVNFLPQAECQNVMLITDLWRNYVLHDSFVCGLGKTRKNACTGDEGGFVICPSKKRPGTYLQIGVISMGINCDDFGRPGIFTNVLKFLDWINQNYFELGLFDDIDIRSLK